MLVLHTCSGQDHSADLTPSEVTTLGCGCTRNRGHRCDGSRIEWLAPITCGRHSEVAA